jgi:hypothetical protein
MFSRSKKMGGKATNAYHPNHCTPELERFYDGIGRALAHAMDEVDRKLAEREHPQ